MIKLRGLRLAAGFTCLAWAIVACAPAPPAEAPKAAQEPAQYPPQPAPAYGQPGMNVTPPKPKNDALDGGDRELNTPDDADKALADAETELDSLLDGTQVEALGDTRCIRSCKALGSMRRAVDRLCELTDEDDRCESARGRLERSNRRVNDAGCSC
jgi:hypothetical protein